MAETKKTPVKKTTTTTSAKAVGVKKAAIKTTKASDVTVGSKAAPESKDPGQARMTKPSAPVVKASGMSVGVLGLDGKSSGQITLPKEIFGAEVNTNLLAQAIKVYSTNRQSHHGHTKTRGEVNLTTAKWFRQKGTGRARHGAKSAPIFVGGGVAMGPRARKVTLDLPEKMKKAALVSALSQRMKEGEVAAVGGLEKATGKTKEIAGFLKKMEKSSVLIISDKSGNAARASRNLSKVSFLTVEQLNAYEVIRHQSVVLTKEAVEKLEERLVKKGVQK